MLPSFEIAESLYNASARRRIPTGEGFDAILVQAGVTHPLDAWLDALAPQGRLIFPLTATSAETGPIGKGVVVLLSKNAGGFPARAVTLVAIYSAVGVRGDALNDLLGASLRRTPFPRLSRYRRDGHEQADACWWHAGLGWLS